jgi:hypothetical protein
MPMQASASVPVLVRQRLGVVESPVARASDRCRSVVHRRVAVAVSGAVVLVGQRGPSAMKLHSARNS